MTRRSTILLATIVPLTLSAILSGTTLAAPSAELSARAKKVTDYL